MSSKYKMTPGDAIGVVFFFLALFCYLIGHPNGGHGFMFLTVLTAIEEAKNVIIAEIKKPKE